HSQLQSGDFETQNQDRKGGHSTFDTKYFDDENYEIHHNKRGILSMDNFGWANTNSSRFFVTFTDTPWCRSSKRSHNKASGHRELWTAMNLELKED
ncbi:PPIase cyclophilin-type domain-containing protein, partial [Trichostrongylus colubriformis]